MMAIYDPKKSLDLLLSGDLPENEALNHLDMLADLLDRLTYRMEVFKPGTHKCDGQDVEAYEDGGRYFFDKPDFDWTDTTAALIAEIDAKLWGRVDLLARCIRAGNRHILGTEQGRELMAGLLREPTKRQVQARGKQIRDSRLCSKARAAKELMGAPKTTTTRAVKSAIDLAIQSELEIDPKFKIKSPESFQRHLLGTRKAEE